MSALARTDRFFHVSERGSSFGAELRGGSVSFLASAYIIPLNAIILGSAADIGGNKLSIPQVAAVTALSAALASFVMGIHGKFPMLMATGLGLNGVIAYQVAPQMTWYGAMGIVVSEGVLVWITVETRLREKIFDVVDRSFTLGIAASIGFFLAAVAFIDAGFIRRNPDISNTPIPSGIGIGGRLMGWPTLVFVFGVLFTGFL